MDQIQNEIRRARYAKALSFYKLATLILTISTAILAAVSFATKMNGSTRFLQASSAAVITLYVLIASSAIIALSSLFIFKSGYKIASGVKPVSYLAALPGLASLAILASSFPEFAKDTDDILTMLVALAAFFSLLHFLSHIINIGKSLALISAYLTIIFCFFIIAKLHFDFAIEMNAPAKLAIQFAAGASAFSILSDIRNVIDRPSPAQFVFAKTCTPVFSALCAAAAFTEVLENAARYGAYYILFPVFFAAYAIYSLANFFTAEITEFTPINEDDPEDPSPKGNAASDTEQGESGESESVSEEVTDSIAPETESDSTHI